MQPDAEHENLIRFPGDYHDPVWWPERAPEHEWESKSDDEKLDAAAAVNATHVVIDGVEFDVATRRPVADARLRSLMTDLRDAGQPQHIDKDGNVWDTATQRIAVAATKEPAAE